MAGRGLLNSAISLYYYAQVVRQMYLAAPTDEQPVRFPVPAFLSLAVALVGVFALGVVSDPFLAFAQTAVTGMVR